MTHPVPTETQAKPFRQAIAAQSGPRPLAVAAVLILAGAATGLWTPGYAAAQANQPIPAPATPPPSTPTPAPGAKESDAGSNPQREAELARIREMQRSAAERQAEAARRQAGAVDGGEVIPGGVMRDGAVNGDAAGLPGAMVPAAPVDPAGAGALVGQNGEISLNFTDPVDLAALVDWVSRVLNINIIADEGLQGRRVVFRAPLKVNGDDLLKLLGRLLEDQDFVFSKDPLGFYTVKQAARIPFVLEGAGVELATTKIIATPMVRPSAMQQAVQQAMGGQNGGAVQGLRITPIDDIGVLIVTASPGSIATVEQLIQSINAELGHQKLTRFPLRHVSADFALNRVLVLNGKISQQMGGGVPPGSVQVPNAGGGVSGSLTHLDSRLFIDPGNAIIFRGTAAEAEQVGEIIRVIDTVSTLITKRYVTGSVTGEIASAGERAGLGPITQTGSGQTGGFSGSSFGNQRIGGIGSLQGQSQGGDLPGSGFTVDTEKGSIIYYGTEEQHAYVAELVKTFTEQALSEDVEIRAYKLLYAKAKETAEVLNELLQSPQDRTTNSPFLPRTNANRGTSSPLVTPPNPEAPANSAAGGDDGASLTATTQDTVVVADEDRNQILVKAAGRQQREFARIIKKLDERQPQVYVEAKIVAVRLDNTFNFRADLQIDASAFQFLSSFGLTAPATVGTTASAFNTRRVIPSPTGVSGATAALLNQDNVLGVINALQTIGDAKIISTPRILVNDNEEANQESTREEPFSATSQTSGSPTITSQGGTATAGTKLKVKPTISQNGDVILEYEIELSNFDRSAGSSGGTLQPPKQQEKYTSIVTVPSDSTIVVGGFTFESRQKTDNKVPFLGDIPVIGLLFKSISEVTNKTTIFVFITPRVLNDPTGADLRILSEGPAREMEIDGVVPELNPETIAISPGTLALPELDQSRGTPGAIDPMHKRRPALPWHTPRPDPAVMPISDEPVEQVPGMEPEISPESPATP